MHRFCEELPAGVGVLQQERISDDHRKRNACWQRRFISRARPRH